MNPSSWQAAKRVLCVRLDYMGDVLMCTPALRALRQAVPGREITLLTSAGGAAVAGMIPEVDRSLVWPAPWMKNSIAHEPALDFEMLARLRQENFDAAVIFTTYSQSALPAAMACYLAGIGLRLAHCRENPYQLLSDWVPDPEPDKCLRHEVQRQLDLVAAIGASCDNQKLSFAVPAEATEWASRQLRELEMPAQWVLLHPGASAASRRYPAASWSAVADLLVEQGLPVLFSGSADEAGLIEGIRADMRGDSISLAGALDLGRLGALIAAAPVMVSNNTGPAHLAAALGTPLVDLYALTNPQHTPWQVASRVLYHMVPCRNCYKSVCPQVHQACLANVKPTEVVQAIRELLTAPETRTHTELLQA